MALLTGGFFAPSGYIQLIECFLSVVDSVTLTSGGEFPRN